MPSLTSIQAKSGSSSSDVEDGTGIGSFDYWLNVSGYNYNYLSLAKDANSNNVASFVYAGLQSKYYDAYSAADALATNYARNGKTVVTEMQEMTTPICNQTNVWNKKWGNMAKLYRYDATDTDFAWEADALNIDSDSDGTADTWDPAYHTGKSDKLIYDTTNTLTDVKYGIQDDIGSFALKDTSLHLYPRRRQPRRGLRRQAARRSRALRPVARAREGAVISPSIVKFKVK